MHQMGVYNRGKLGLIVQNVEQLTSTSTPSGEIYIYVINVLGNVYILHWWKASVYFQIQVQDLHIIIDAC